MHRPMPTCPSPILKHHRGVENAFPLDPMPDFDNKEVAKKEYGKKPGKPAVKRGNAMWEHYTEGGTPTPRLRFHEQLQVCSFLLDTGECVDRSVEPVVKDASGPDVPGAVGGVIRLCHQLMRKGWRDSDIKPRIDLVVKHTQKARAAQVLSRALVRLDRLKKDIRQSSSIAAVDRLSHWVGGVTFSSNHPEQSIAEVRRMVDLIAPVLESLP